MGSDGDACFSSCAPFLRSRLLSSVSVRREGTSLADHPGCGAAACMARAFMPSVNGNCSFPEKPLQPRQSGAFFFFFCQVSDDRMSQQGH